MPKIIVFFGQHRINDNGSIHSVQYKEREKRENMKKLIKNGIFSMLCALLLVTVVNVAASEGALEITINTDKDSYELREPIQTTIKAKNNKSEKLSQLKITATLPDELVLTENSKSETSFESLESGASASFDFTMISKAKKDYDTSVAFTQSVINKTLGDEPFVNPIKGYNDLVDYRSSNSKIASVDQNGLITIHDAGSCMIHAVIPETNDFNSTAISFTLNVNKKNMEQVEQSIKFEKNMIEWNLDDGSFSNALSDTGKGKGAITYLSADETIAVVDANTGKVTPLKVGTVTISATKAADELYQSASASYVLSIKKSNSITDVDQTTDKNDSKNDADLSDNKTNNGGSVDTGEKGNARSMFLFLISSGCIMILLNKKFRKKFFILFLTATLISLNTSSINATEMDTPDDPLNIHVTKKIKVGADTYTVSIEATYKIDEDRSNVLDDDIDPVVDTSDYINDTLYSDTGDDGNRAYNSETFETYYDNELILFTKDIPTRDLVDTIAQTLPKFHVVGLNEDTKTLQIRFTEMRGYDDLQDAIGKCSNLDQIEDASLNYTFEIDELFVPNDVNTQLNESDTVKSWWLNSIHIKDVWNDHEHIPSTMIGVFDSGFLTTQEDLKDQFASVAQGKDNSPYHGTMVSGVIAAGFNNGKGVSGIHPNAKLHALSYTSIDPDDPDLKFSGSYIEFMRYQNSLTYLLQQNCKIINCSLGYGSLIPIMASQDLDPTVQKIARMQADLISEKVERSLDTLLDQYDFLICQAAGNHDDSYVYSDKIPDKIGNYYETDGKRYYSWSESYYDETTKRWESSDHESEYKGEKLLVNPITYAEYCSPYAGIKSQKVRDHIIVVGGAMTNDGSDNYLYSFSSIGDRVDVLAPGHDVTSTYADKENLNNDHYYINGAAGTSVATPIVSGLAGILNSIDPTLTGPQIKEIIIKTATTKVNDSHGVNMINAYKAYQEVVQGSVSGKVIDEKSQPVVGATVKCLEGKHSVTTAEDGTFTLNCKVGDQYFVIEKDGYEPYTGYEKIESFKTTKLDKEIVLLAGDSEFKGFAGGDGSPENPYQVSTPEMLNAVRNDVYAHYIQINDIDLTKYESWKPIGDKAPFYGNYDGGNFKIKNLNINTIGDSDSLGLFSTCHGILKNIHLENLNIDLEKTDFIGKELRFIGGIVGSYYSPWDYKVTNCSVDGQITAMNIYTIFVGGVIGHGDGDHLKNYADIFVYNDPTGFDNTTNIWVYAGGITASNEHVTNSVNYGNLNITAQFSTIVGGISGESEDTQNCINYGNISASTTVEPSYVNGKTVAGGIIGSGDNYKHSLNDCINFGNIDAYCSSDNTSYAGGLCGQFAVLNADSIINCYNLANSITAYGVIKEKDGKKQLVDGYPGRITSDHRSHWLNGYSIDSTLINGKIPNEDCEINLKNGLSLTKEEIEEKIKPILNKE